MRGKTADEIISRDGNNLDIIRLLAAISVIIYHSFALNPQWALTDPIKNLLGYVTTGGLAVKIFFFISGILVTNSILTRKSAYQFIVSRVLRIFPALVFVVFCSGFIIGPIFTSLPIKDYFSSSQLYSYVFNNIILNTRYFLPEVLTGNKYGINGSLWTIYYEVIAYIVLLLLYLVGFHKSTFISSIICMIIIIEPVTPLKGVLFATSSHNAIYLLAPCFALGALVALNKKFYKSNIKIPAMLFLLQFLLPGEEIKPTLMCFSLCLAALHLSSLEFVKKIKIKHDISYGVYLWGFPIQQIFSQYFSFGFVINVTISVIVTMIIALASWLFIEKPSMNLAKRIAPSKYLPNCTKTMHNQ